MAIKPIPCQTEKRNLSGIDRVLLLVSLFHKCLSDVFALILGPSRTRIKSFFPARPTDPLMIP